MLPLNIVNNIYIKPLVSLQMKASQKQKIYTSLATVDKAVNAQIYFEILYLHYFDTHLNHAPAREQRK